MIEKQQLASSLVVTQANELIEAKYNLSIGEQRLVFTMLSRIQPEDEDFKPYKISLKELAEFLGLDRNHMYAECKQLTKKLLGRVIEIREPNKLLQTHWVSSADYIDGSGMVNLTFDPLLKPYLLQIKGNFTSSKLEMLLSFKSQYTMRIYMLLKQYERLKSREVELEPLRSILGIAEDEYTLYANFKARVLVPVQKELELTSDVYFEFDEIKYGRGVGAIRFKILTKKQATSPLKILVPITLTLDATQEGNAKVEALLNLVPEQHRNKKTVLSAIESFEKKNGFEYVKRNILYSNSKAEKSYAGFLSNALKDDWGHDWELAQGTTEKKKVLEVWERAGFTSKKEYDERMYKEQMQKYGVMIN